MCKSRVPCSQGCGRRGVDKELEPRRLNLTTCTNGVLAKAILWIAVQHRHHATHRPSREAH